MRQELEEIAKLGQIDAEIAERLKACMGSEFKPSPIRCFETRKVIFFANTDQPLTIRISGFDQTFKGKQLTCSNTDNPENLEVDTKENQKVLRSVKDPGVFCVQGGQTSITGPKQSDVTKDLDASPEALKIIPRKDPDRVSIDGKEYRQTGTVHVSGPAYFVIVER